MSPGLAWEMGICLSSLFWSSAVSYTHLEYLVLGFVGDGELDAGERGAGVEGVMGVAAQGLGVLQLDVGLRHLHATADDIVAAGIAG